MRRLISARWMRPLVLVLVALYLDAAHADGFPEVPVPKGAQVSIVGEDLKVNGFPMRIYELHSDSSSKKISDFYVQRWAGSVEIIELPGWRVVSHPEDEFLFTVQLRSAHGGGSFGYIALSPAFTSSARIRRQRVELPPGSEVLSDLESKDRSRSSRTIVFRNQMSVDQNVAWIDAYYARKGWKGLSPASQGTGVERGQALLLTKAGGEVNLAVTRYAGASYGTIVVVEP